MARPRTRSDDEILEAVGVALGRYGPRDLTLAHVAGEVGLTPSALMRRFGSKAGLLQAFARREADRAWLAPPPDGTPVERLLDAASAGIDAMADRRRFAHHLDLLSLDLRDPVLGEAARHQARGRRHVIDDLLTEGVADGSLAPHDASRQARLLLAVIQGSILSWVIDGRGPMAEWVRADVAAAIEPLRRAPGRPAEVERDAGGLPPAPPATLDGGRDTQRAIPGAKPSDD
jgi:AcrR family transcriptional regulator